MEENLHLKEFFIEGGSRKQSHVVLQISEPTTLDEKEKGYFFIIGEINNADQNYLTKFYEIIDSAQKSYYQNRQQKNNDSLETVLNLLNHQTTYLTTPAINLHCVVGVAYQNEAIFSFCGEPQIILFYKTSHSNGYERMDLVKSNALSDDSPTNILFPQLIQGKITAQDLLFFSTPHVITQINADRLQKIITTRTPEQSCQHLENILRQLGSNYSYAGLIMYQDKISVPPLPTSTRGNLETSTKSLHNFFNTEQRTVQTLSSKNQEKLKNRRELSPSSNPVSFTKNQSHESISSYTTVPTFKQNSPTFFWQKVFTLINYSGKFCLNLFIIIWRILNDVFKQTIFLFYVITNYKNKRSSTLESWQRQIYSRKQNIKQLPPLTKIMLISSIVLAGIFIASLVYIRINDKKNRQLKAYQIQLQLIKTKKDSAESALIYKDESTAKKEIQEAQTALKNLPCQTKTEKETCQQLQQDIDELLSKIKRISIVKTSALITWKQTNLKGIVALGDKIVSYSPTTNSLFIYKLSDGTATIQTNTSTTSGFIAATVSQENNFALFITNNNELIQFKPDNSTKNIAISYQGVGNDSKDLVIYNQRLYRLDSESNQIYRHNLSNNNFGSGKGWLQDNQVSIKNAVSITIDGDIFLLNNNGEVTKLTKGIKQNFKIKGLDPELKGGQKIWTYTDLKNIYILDQTEKRLVIIDKDGNLKLQLKAPELKNPTDMVIDEVNKSALILDGSTIYKINLPL